MLSDEIKTKITRILYGNLYGAEGEYTANPQLDNALKRCADKIIAEAKERILITWRIFRSR